MHSSCDLPGGNLTVPPNELPLPDADFNETGEQSIVLAGGCFWCVEAVYAQLEGVESVTAGYAGGLAETADYRSVCSGNTDHAEVVRITYNADRISLGRILQVFFSVAHDATQLNRQGNDVGRQYRSAIFYANDAQYDYAAGYLRQLDEGRLYKSPIQTTLEPLTAFYEAESYHQNYAALNPGQPYIQGVSMPKVEKLRRFFTQQVKSDT